MCPKWYEFLVIRMLGKMRKIQLRASVGYLTKRLEKRYREGLRWDSRQNVSTRDTGKVLGGTPDKDYIDKRYSEGLWWDSWQRLSKRDTAKVFGGMPDRTSRREIQGRPSDGCPTKEYRS